MSEWSGTCMWRLWSLVAAESRNPQRAWAAEENPLAWNREKREKEDKGRKKVGGQINSLFFSASKSYSFSFVYHYQKKSRRKRGCWCCYRAMKNMCGGCGGCMGQQNFRFHIVESHSSLSFWIQSRSSCHINTEKLAAYIQKLFSNEPSELQWSWDVKKYTVGAINHHPSTAEVAKAPAVLMWKHGGRSLLRPVRADQSEHTGFFGGG